MRRLSLALVASALVLTSVTSAVAAPIDLTLRLDPGQPASSAMFSWSLLLRADPGYPVGAVAVMTSGLTSFAIDPTDLDISAPDSGYLIDPLGDGRNLLVIDDTFVSSPFSGTPLSPPGVETRLATLFGPNRTAPPVALQDCEDLCGYTVADLLYNPIPLGLLAIHVVPEPEIDLLVAGGLAAAPLLRSRRRSGAA
jgi:hypothetical protein